jgi:hypothetical protein
MSSFVGAVHKTVSCRITAATNMFALWALAARLSKLTAVKVEAKANRFAITASGMKARPTEVEAVPPQHAVFKF